MFSIKWFSFIISFRPQVLLRQSYGIGDPVAPTFPGWIVIAGIVRHLCLRLLIRKKGIAPVLFPRVRITQLNQQFDPLFLRRRNRRGLPIRLS